MRTLYLDMDGVVADFNAYAKKILNTTETYHTWPVESWQKISSNPRLYRDLNKTPEADDLFKFCKNLCDENNWNLLFLTAVPKEDSMPWSYYDKINWIQTHYNNVPVHFGPYSNTKWKHCKKGDILIDDRPSNIKEWNNAQGCGILHNGNLSETIENILKIL